MKSYLAGAKIGKGKGTRNTGTPVSGQGPRSQYTNSAKGEGANKRGTACSIKVTKAARPT